MKCFFLIFNTQPYICQTYSHNSPLTLRIKRSRLRNLTISYFTIPQELKLSQVSQNIPQLTTAYKHSHNLHRGLKDKKKNRDYKILLLVTSNNFNYQQM